VIGEGEIMAVSLCDDQTTYDTKVSVFSGDCDNLECIGGNDDFQGCDLASAYSWTPIPGEKYYILVRVLLLVASQIEISLVSNSKQYYYRFMAMILPLGSSQSKYYHNDLGNLEHLSMPPLWLSAALTRS
jgi:hypothetical protein